jgi:hypothetical protein
VNGTDHAASAAARPGADSGPDAGTMLGATRLGIGILLVLAIANGAFLYLFPSQAEANYAWAIVPPVSAAFMGAGYIGGILATALAVTSRSFAPVRPLVPALCVLGVILFAATMIHADRFRWDFPATWVWTLVYASLPVVGGYLWLLQARSAPAPGSRERLAGPLRTVTLALGVLLLVVAAVLFVAPDGVLDEWPWPITPLLSRVFAGWFALAGVALAFAAVTISRPSEGLMVYGTFVVWSVCSLLLIPLYEEDMRTDAAGYWAFIGGFVVVGLSCAWALAKAAADREPAPARP